MELFWRDGTPPYSVWFNSTDESTRTSPDPKLGAWHNLTGRNYLVPCRAPAGSTLFLVLRDSTGWISMSPGTFVVLPSSDSACLTASDDSGLAQSQSTLSTLLWDFQHVKASIPSYTELYSHPPRF
ncbi:hypothetical protein FS749_010244 [Ceratobasidium sp. UAMH 11750]|nr:hypothetical protein FS749_010244 [Ceratobasidium sp. UAMH 11750]